ncbi:MAG: site-specific integrase [Burkholderiales bacterium]|nr:site-specific integrase [Burkholderiales bacterium]
MLFSRPGSDTRAPSKGFAPLEATTKLAGKGYWYDKTAKLWRIRFAIPGQHGRSYKASLGSEWTERQVIEHVANTRKQSIDGTLGREDRLIADALEIFLERAEGEFKGYAKLQGHVKAIWPWIDGKRFSEIGEIARNYRRFHKGKISGATINRRIALLRRVTNIAWKELRWIDRPVHFEMAREKARTTHLTMDQVEALVAKLDHQPTIDAVWIAVCTGMRQGEIWSLTQRNVRGDVLVLGDTKNSDPRLCPIVDQIKEAVARLPMPCGHRWVYLHFKAAAKAIGMPDLRFHDLRHTTASLIINAGGSLKDVQEVLGQRSVASANRYAHMLTERKRAVLAMALKPSIAPEQGKKIGGESA